MNRVKFLICLTYAVITCTVCTGRNPSEEVLTLYLSGKDFYIQNDLSRAESFFRKAVKMSPDFYQARFMLGKTLYFAEKTEEAEELLIRLLRRHPDYREAELFYIRICIEAGKTGEAIQRTERLLAYDSSDPRLLYLRAQLYQLEEELSASLDYYNKAALFEEEFARVFLDLGRIYFIFGMFESAEKNVRKSVCLLPEDSPLANPVQKLLVRLEEENDVQK